MTLTVLDAARSAHAAGMCVLPVAEDGTKRPDCFSWKPYQLERPSEDQQRQWFSARPRTGLAVVCGHVSGDLECVDFDERATYDDYTETAQRVGLGALVGRIERGYCEDTPNGGVHWFYACTAIGGSSKLARRPKRSEEQNASGDKIQTLIETKGEGGYAVVAPSHGGVHETGRPYRLRSGGFASIVTITPAERHSLLQLACTFDQMPGRERSTGGVTAGGHRPGDDFAARTGWAEILQPGGWTFVSVRGDTDYWRRPGKTGKGISATVNHLGSDLLYVFSSSTDFETERGYGKFAAYAVLNHSGDFSAAAKALGGQGYGSAPSARPRAQMNVVPFRPASSPDRQQGSTQPDVESLLAQCDLATIPAPPSPANMVKLEERLRRVTTALEAADPLRIATVRGVLLLSCQAASVPSPAALIDSALAPLKKTATDRDRSDLLLFPDDDPWPAPVDGDVLLDAICEVIRQHVVLPPGAAIAIALWCLHTHLMACWDVSSFLLITSPVWRCGKSTLADFVAGCSHRALTASSASDAVVYRCIEKFAPTLILDEADSWLKMREELRGILNSGHKRSGAKVLRSDGDTHEPRAFSTWAPKVVALIGRPPATIGDRSIEIPMRRKTKQERVKRIRSKKLQALCEPLRRQSARWADDHRTALSTAEPVLPDALTDRAQDNWEALIAIADEIGGPYPLEARDAALLLSNGAAQEEAVGIDLLFDIKSIFDDENPSDGCLGTKTLLDRLCEREDRPWATWGRQQKPMTSQALASLLKPFGPKPGDKRAGEKVRKGYNKADFLESWARYGPADLNPGDPAATSLQVNENGDKPQDPVRYTPPDVADAQSEVSPVNTGENGECSGVAARKPDPGETPVFAPTVQPDPLAAEPSTDPPETRQISADEELL